MLTGSSYSDELVTRAIIDDAEYLAGIERMSAATKALAAEIEATGMAGTVGRGNAAQTSLQAARAESTLMTAAGRQQINDAKTLTELHRADTAAAKTQAEISRTANAASESAAKVSILSAKEQAELTATADASRVAAAKESVLQQNLLTDSAREAKILQDAQIGVAKEQALIQGSINDDAKSAAQVSLINQRRVTEQIREQNLLIRQQKMLATPERSISNSTLKHVGDGMLVGGALSLAAVAGPALMAAKFQSDIAVTMNNMAENGKALDQATRDHIQAAALAGAEADAADPAEVAKAYFRAYNFGITGASADIVVKEAMDSAVALGGDPQQTTEILSTVLHDWFNSDATKSKPVMEMLHMSSMMGDVDLPQLVQYLRPVMGPAATVGISPGDAAAYFASLTQMGYNASQAATGLKNLTAKLLKETPGGEKALADIDRRTGTTLVKDFSVEGVGRIGLSGIIKELNEAQDKLGVNDNSIAGVLNSLRGGLPLFATVHDTGWSAYSQISAANDEAMAGNTNNIGEGKAQYLKTWDAAVKELNVSLIELGNTATPSLLTVMHHLTGLVDDLDKVPGPVKTIVTDFLLIGGSTAIVAGVTLKVVALWRETSELIATLKGFSILNSVVGGFKNLQLWLTTSKIATAESAIASNSLAAAESRAATAAVAEDAAIVSALPVIVAEGVASAEAAIAVNSLAAAFGRAAIMATGFKVAAAGIVGWEIGSWLNDNFLHSQNWVANNPEDMTDSGGRSGDSAIASAKARWKVQHLSPAAMKAHAAMIASAKAAEQAGKSANQYGGALPADDNTGGTKADDEYDRLEMIRQEAIAREKIDKLNGVSVTKKDKSGKSDIDRIDEAAQAELKHLDAVLALTNDKANQLRIEKEILGVKEEQAEIDHKGKGERSIESKIIGVGGHITDDLLAQWGVTGAIMTGKAHIAKKSLKPIEKQPIHITMPVVFDGKTIAEMSKALTVLIGPELTKDLTQMLERSDPGYTFN